MNWENNTRSRTLEKYFQSKPSYEEKYHNKYNMELLCREIETLTKDSDILDAQYKAIVNHYQNLARQVIA